jgi:hypothetical protein
MVRVINKGVVKLGEIGQSGSAIITGANLRRPKKKPLEAEPDDNSDPLSASTPKEALAMAIKFLEGLKPATTSIVTVKGEEGEDE